VAEVILYQFRPPSFLPNTIPCCMKLETHLRMSGAAQLSQTLEGFPELQAVR
jgi:hypothetical protein